MKPTIRKKNEKWICSLKQNENIYEVAGESSADAIKKWYEKWGFELGFLSGDYP